MPIHLARHRVACRIIKLANAHVEQITDKDTRLKSGCAEKKKKRLVFLL